MRYATHAITELYRDWPHLPVGALVVLREDFDDKVAGWVDEYSASGLNSNSHLVDRLRLVRPSDGKRFSHVFNRRSPEKHGYSLSLRPSHRSPKLLLFVNLVNTSKTAKRIND